MHTCTDALIPSNRGVPETHSHRGTHVCTKLCKGGKAEMGSQVGMHT